MPPPLCMKPSLCVCVCVCVVGEHVCTCVAMWAAYTMQCEVGRLANDGWQYIRKNGKANFRLE